MAWIHERLANIQYDHVHADFAHALRYGMVHAFIELQIAVKILRPIAPHTRSHVYERRPDKRAFFSHRFRS
jgi:hypothetical protein